MYVCLCVCSAGQEINRKSWTIFALNVAIDHNRWPTKGLTIFNPPPLILTKRPSQFYLYFGRLVTMSWNLGWKWSLWFFPHPLLIISPKLVRILFIKTLDLCLQVDVFNLWVFNNCRERLNIIAAFGKILVRHLATSFITNLNTYLKFITFYEVIMVKPSLLINTTITYFFLLSNLVINR